MDENEAEQGVPADHRIANVLRGRAEIALLVAVVFQMVSVRADHYRPAVCALLVDHITVADKGQGIGAENIGKIVAPFFTTILGQGTVFTLLIPCRVAPPP